MTTHHRAAIEEAIRRLGLRDQVVCCHSSMRSFSESVRAETVIGTMLDAGITLLVPAFTYHYGIAPPPGDRPERNGFDYQLGGDESSTGGITPFDPTGNDLSRRDMGALPAALLEYQSRARGNHPGNSFAAVGPLAEALVAGQTATEVYAPFEALLRHGGKLLMLGTGPTTLTFIHFAEQQAGRRLFIRWALDPQGRTIRVRGGGCSNGFGRLEPVLSNAASTASCIGSTWTALDANDVLPRLIGVIRAEPGITHCGDQGCERCNDAVMGGPREAD